MSSGERDYYEVLGVPRDADEKAIKRAYKRQAMKYHPDRNKDPDAEEKFKELAKAYALLSDPQKRKMYDAGGMGGVSHFSDEDLFRNVDFGDIFGGFGVDFGVGGGSIFDRFFRQPQQRQTHGVDLRVRMPVTLDRVCHGGSELLRFTRRVACPACHGHGTRSGKPPAQCQRCQGSGRQVIASEEGGGQDYIQLQRVVSCPACHGRGVVIDDPCPRCGGTAEVEREESLKITIPAGIEDGSVMRVPGHGLPAGEAGMPAGDLYVEVYTLGDPRFQRHGADLWHTERLSVPHAVLGAKLRVPTVDGEVDVTIPPGMQPDEMLRLRGKGLPRYRAKGLGDLILRIEVVIPERLSDEERGLYQRLAALRH
ncbi:MAG: J domain-containing protein [Gammaproteobacteria bacterium]|nr:J domain-containing protein [Gammaproteobacteria bacterium]